MNKKSLTKLVVGVILSINGFSVFADNGFTDKSYGPIYPNSSVTNGDHATTTTKGANDNVAIGGNAYAVDKNGSGGATAIGANAYVDGTDSIAIGDVAINTGSGSIVIGSGGASRKEGSPKSVVTGNNSIGIGSLTAVTGNSSSALGAGTKITGNNSVALGAGTSVTEDNVVGVGGRRLTQIGNATADTDATSLGQVKSLIAQSNNTTDEKLDGKANDDASNIGTNIQGEAAQKANLDVWGKALGTGVVKSGNTQLITGGTMHTELRNVTSTNYISALIQKEEQKMENTNIENKETQALTGEKMMTRYEYAQMLYNALLNGRSVDQSEIDEYTPELTEILNQTF